ncbi:MULTISPECIES: DUF3717 domain-containing protein [Burkholderia cepacia complex]|uniref:Uncharacterized protein n=1 Tax=Burkholderia pseudomultivorans TaxID=1207504 RepID=A0A132EM55_9BURK|nr:MULTISPECIES: DUF3717 domain-containing protein [Burkholderia cepacia complex]KWE97898.1 hypothetical protein WL81_02375 [Burkholderia ubonensis]KWF37413.1 hypothetical protein WT56_34300 [Burkholderia pseudomultivorans]
MPVFSVGQVKQAVKYWRAREAVAKRGQLGPRASALVALCDRMAARRIRKIKSSGLTQQQAEALEIALYQQDLPL